MERVTDAAPLDRSRVRAPGGQPQAPVGRLPAPSLPRRGRQPRAGSRAPSMARRTSSQIPQASREPRQPIHEEYQVIHHEHRTPQDREAPRNAETPREEVTHPGITTEQASSMIHFRVSGMHSRGVTEGSPTR